MNKKDKIWIKTMDWCSKYWGCHQLPERSFFLGQYQFPVCARCTGIIIGYIVSTIYAIFFEKVNLITCMALMIPLSIDGSLQLFTNYLSNNIKRMITGILAGFGFIQIIKTLFLLLMQ